MKQSVRQVYHRQSKKVRIGRGRYCSPSCWDASRPSQTVAVRFWRYVQRTESCWIWTGSKNGSGYGQIQGDPPNRRPLVAHRVSWEIHFGAIPSGMFVCHNCPGGDNPACVNPAHLWLGAHSENMADMVAKGRSTRGDRSPSRLRPDRLRRGDNHPYRMNPALAAHGETHCRAKLTQQQVNEIRERYAAGGITHQQLAAEYGVAQSGITRIINGRRWKHPG